MILWNLLEMDSFISSLLVKQAPSLLYVTPIHLLGVCELIITWSFFVAIVTLSVFYWREGALTLFILVNTESESIAKRTHA